MAGSKRLAFGFASRSEKLTDGIKSFDISNRIGPRGSANGRLIHQDNVRDPLISFQLLVIQLLGSFPSPGPEGCIDDFMNQCGFTRAGYTRYACHDSQRNSNIHLFQIMLPGSIYSQPVPVRRAACFGNVDSQVMLEVSACERVAG